MTLMIYNFKIKKMKKVIFFYVQVALLFFFMTSCNNGKSKDTGLSPKNDLTEQIGSIPDSLLGVYQGVQPEYFMKNKYGEDLVLNGQKIFIPAIDFTFSLKEKGVATLNMKSHEDNQEHFYAGTYKVLSDEPNLISLEVNLDDNQDSTPTYILEISKSDKTGVCPRNNEPEFSISKKN